MENQSDGKVVFSLPHQWGWAHINDYFKYHPTPKHSDRMKRIRFELGEIEEANRVYGIMEGPDCEEKAYYHNLYGK